MTNAPDTVPPPQWASTPGTPNPSRLSARRPLALVLALGGLALGGLALGGLTLGAAAQVCVPDPNANQGPVNNVPLGGKGPSGSSQNVRTQIRIPASALPASGVSIDEVSLAGASNGRYLYGLLEVRLAHLTGAALSTTFAQNLGGPVVVLRQTTASVAMQAGAFTPLGLTGTFAHDGRRDLVVDIIVQAAFFTGSVPGSHRSQTLETVFLTGYDPTFPAPAGFGPFLSGAKLCLRTTAGSVMVTGTGCPQGNGQPVGMAWSGSTALGTTLNVDGRGAPPSTALVLLAGSNSQRFGSLTLPFDLAPIGAPGCLLRTDVLALVPAVTNAAGDVTLPLPIPTNTALRGQRLLVQWLSPDPTANALGFVLSAMLDATLR